MELKFKSVSPIRFIRNYKQIFLCTYLIFLGIILVYLVVKVENVNQSVANLSRGLGAFYNSSQGNTDIISSLFTRERLSNHLTTTDLIDNKIDKLDTNLSTSISDAENHSERRMSRIEGTISSMNKTLDLIQLDLLKLLTK